MSQPTEQLGAVVLSFGRANQHVALVRSLIEEHGLSEQAIVVVHNAYDRSDRWEPAAVGEVQTVCTGDNLGYAGGMNAGIARHLREGRRWVLCLTHEARPQPGCVARLAAAGVSSDDVGVVGPVLSSGPGHDPWSAGVMSIRGGMRHRLAVSSDVPLAPCDSVDGSAMLIRMAAYTAAGQFDERMFMYWEETELCLRVRQLGWTVGVAPGALATAVPGGEQRSAAHAYLTARNGLLYARQQHRRGAVAARLGRSLLDISRGIPKPGGKRSRDPQTWRVAAVRTWAAAWGLVDYRRGRWGQPPSPLLRGSDIRRTSSEPPISPNIR